jgi:adenylate kinase
VYVVLLGLPGAGKGTQAQRLKESAGLAHITTGELFRENIRKGTALGTKAQPYYDAGDLVPNELTIGMLLDRLRDPDTASGCLFDGYPRNLEIVPLLNAAIESYKEMADFGGSVGIKATFENHWGLAADPMNIFSETIRPCFLASSMSFLRADPRSRR